MTISAKLVLVLAALTSPALAYADPPGHVALDGPEAHVTRQQFPNGSTTETRTAPAGRTFAGGAVRVTTLEHIPGGRFDSMTVHDTAPDPAHAPIEGHAVSLSVRRYAPTQDRTGRRARVGNPSSRIVNTFRQPDGSIHTVSRTFRNANHYASPLARAAVHVSNAVNAVRRH